MTKSYLFKPEFYEDFFQFSNNSDIRFAEDILRAVDKVDRAFTPRSITHPYLDEIKQGIHAYESLFNYLEKPREGTTKEDVLDAFSYIFLNIPASPEVLARLRPYLVDEELGTFVARALAIGQDTSFLLDLLEGLQSDDPSVVSATALLLGHGRFKEAASLLSEMISPTRFVESQAIIWALGEIGDEVAVPYLHKAALEHFRMEETLHALGKIGSLRSLDLLLQFILEGSEKDRELALQALSSLLTKLPTELSWMEPLQATLTPVLETLFEHESLRVRYFSLLCFARLGGQLSKKKMSFVLDLDYEEPILSSMELMLGKS